MKLFTGSQRVGHELEAEQQQRNTYISLFIYPMKTLSSAIELYTVLSFCVMMIIIYILSLVIL